VSTSRRLRRAWARSARGMSMTGSSCTSSRAFRDVARAADIKEDGFDVRPGSFDEPDELRAAVSGADTVFINATFFGAATELRGKRVATAIGAAAEAGASRIIITTWPTLNHATLPSVQDYAQSERLVRRAGPS
jgi:NAD(P)H dehydrogenase (quinone)